MESDTQKQDSPTGSGQPEAVTELGSVPTGDDLKPAQVKKDAASIKIGQLLSLLQTDYFDLQQAGCTILILAENDKLYAKIAYPGHVIGKEDGNITLDGVNVNTIN